VVFFFTVDCGLQNLLMSRRTWGYRASYMQRCHTTVCFLICLLYTQCGLEMMPRNWTLQVLMMLARSKLVQQRRLFSSYDNLRPFDQDWLDESFDNCIIFLYVQQFKTFIRSRVGTKTRPRPPYFLIYIDYSYCYPKTENEIMAWKWGFSRRETRAWVLRTVLVRVTVEEL